MFLGDRDKVEVLLKNNIPDILLILHNVLNRFVVPNVVAVPGRNAVGVQALGDHLIAKAVQVLTVYSADNLSLLLNNGKRAVPLAITVDIGQREALHKPLLIPPPFSPFDVIGHQT